jgi:hypothetical protein
MPDTPEEAESGVENCHRDDHAFDQNDQAQSAIAGPVQSA